MLGVGVCCWGLSFYYGCRYVETGQSVLRANHALLREQAEPRTPVAVVKVTELSRILNDQSAASGKYATRQVRFLLIGAGFYIAWHLLGMALCTVSLQPRLTVLGSCVQAVTGH